MLLKLKRELDKDMVYRHYFFNLVLDKVINTCKEGLEKEKIKDEIYFGTNNNNILVKCLAFADDIVLLAENYSTAVRQLEILKEVAGRTGLQVSFEKTEFMSNPKEAPKLLNTGYGVVKRVRN